MIPGGMEQLSGLDASFLYLETPKMHMHVAMCAVLDPSEVPGGYSYERIVRLFESKLHLLPPFRRKLMEDPLGLNHPFWVEDPDFDIIHHIRRITVPAPGGPEQLADLVGRINSAPLPRSRPLWEVWVLEGLANDNFAIVCKVHHACVDGATGAGLLVHLFTMKPEVDIADPAPPPPREEVPSDVELLREAAMARLRQPRQLLEMAKRTAKAARDVFEMRRDPEHTLRGTTPFTAPKTPFNGSITARRAVAFARLPLEGLKRIKRRFEGAKLNDVILAVCAGALRRYLDAGGALPTDPLIAICPISVGGTRGTNHVSGMFVSLATQLDDPEERLRAIQEATMGAKEQHNAIGAEMLQDWAELAAPSTFNLASRFYTRSGLADKHRPIHNLVISNVPGPPFPIYLAGARLEAVYPMGPVMEGAGLNVTVLSYCGEVDFGFMVARDLIPDVWDLAAHVEPAYEELLRAAGAEKPAPKEKRATTAS